jgi:hypothetical protein
MAATAYTYSIGTDTANGKVAPDVLAAEIEDSTEITTDLSYIDTSDDDLDIVFVDALTQDEIDELDDLVAAHEGIPEVSVKAPVDSDNSPIVKPKTTKTGWHYEPRAISFTTSKHGTLHNRKGNNAGVGQGTDYGDATLKFWDSSDDELTQGAEESDEDFQTRLNSNCVKTTIDWWPTYDMDIIGGKMLILNGPSAVGQAYLWCVMASDIPEGSGGNVPFVAGGIDLAFVTSVNLFGIDGRGTKTFLYDSQYASNKLRCIIQHTAGLKIDLLKLYEHFKG